MVDAGVDAGVDAEEPLEEKPPMVVAIFQPTKGPGRSTWIRYYHGGREVPRERYVTPRSVEGAHAKVPSTTWWR